jgi:putative membrane protein
MQLTDDDKRRITDRVRAFEARLPVQAIASVAQKSDDYPEVPWRAFALGASLGCLWVIALAWREATFLTELMTAVLPLLLGAVLMTATVLLPPFGRIFVATARIETEARQYAEGQFLSHELFATPGRCSVLLFLSLFEGEAIVLVDRGLRAHLSDADLRTVATTAAEELRRSGVAAAVEAGLAALEVILLAKGLAGAGGNEIERSLIEGQGHA